MVPLDQVRPLRPQRYPTELDHLDGERAPQTVADADQAPRAADQSKVDRADVYQVDRIMDHKMSKGRLHLIVKWEGYDTMTW